MGSRNSLGMFFIALLLCASSMDTILSHLTFSSLSRIHNATVADFFEIYK